MCFHNGRAVWDASVGDWVFRQLNLNENPVVPNLFYKYFLNKLQKIDNFCLSVETRFLLIKVLTWQLKGWGWNSGWVVGDASWMDECFNKYIWMSIKLTKTFSKCTQKNRQLLFPYWETTLSWLFQILGGWVAGCVLVGGWVEVDNC